MMVIGDVIRWFMCSHTILPHMSKKHVADNQWDPQSSMIKISHNFFPPSQQKKKKEKLSYHEHPSMGTDSKEWEKILEQ